uniref:MADF domain-containing protein n=1 Tax=Knipowitschia caucasica TaxID=637954 RepID=A0AAV2JM98_KNICA
MLITVCKLGSGADGEGGVRNRPGVFRGLPQRVFIFLLSVSCLKKESRNYRDRNKKELAWRRVSEVVGVSVEVCKKRWKNLRDTYEVLKTLPPPHKAAIRCTPGSGSSPAAAPLGAGTCPSPAILILILEMGRAH